MNIASYAILWALVVPSDGVPTNVIIDDRVRMDICVEIVADYIDANQPFPVSFIMANGEQTYVDIPATDLRCQPTEDI